MRQQGFIYLIENLSEKRYLGVTADHQKRVEEHNNGITKSTRGKCWKLVHVWKVSSVKRACQLEYYIKSWKTKLTVENINKIIKKFLDNKGD